MPLIGITTFRGQDSGLPRMKVNEAYVSSIVQAGGTPFLLPVGLTESDLPDVVSRLDGLLFTGGGDIAPQLYGGKADDTVDGVDLARDHQEISLMRLAVAKRLPFLGICRGFEILNVALGGDMFVDIARQFSPSIQHSTPSSQPRSSLVHSVNVEKGSSLAQILGGSEFQVNSLHHQGVNRLAEGLVPTARATDGLVEGLEMPGHPFALGVQWHPEELQAHVPMRALFKAFVQASSRT